MNLDQVVRYLEYAAQALKAAGKPSLAMAAANLRQKVELEQGKR